VGREKQNEIKKKNERLRYSGWYTKRRVGNEIKKKKKEETEYSEYFNAFFPSFFVSFLFGE